MIVIQFINRIVVTCETHDFLEVLWDEERITQIPAWWLLDQTGNAQGLLFGGRHPSYTLPRLDVIQSINDSAH